MNKISLRGLLSAPVHSLIAMVFVLCAAGSAAVMVQQSTQAFELDVRALGFSSALPVLHGTVLGSTTQAVVWTSLVDATVTGTSIAKTTGCSGCLAGGISEQVISSGDGYIEFPVPSTVTESWVGLGTATSATSPIQFSYKLTSGGYAAIRESGTYRTDVAVKAGDVLRIAAQSGKIIYYKNGGAVYTSTATAVYPLRGVAAFVEVAGKISDAVMTYTTTAVTPVPVPTPTPSQVITDTIWTSVVGAVAGAQSLVKNACADCAASAVTKNTIASGDAAFEFTATSNTKEVWAGLMKAGKTPAVDGIEFAFKLTTGGYAAVREGALYRMDLPVATGDVLRVAVESGKVKYYKNSSLVYTGTGVVSYPLVGAAVLVSADSSISGAGLRALVTTQPSAPTPPPAVTPTPTPTPPPAPVPLPTVNSKPTGSFDGIMTEGIAYGWAKDTDALSQSVAIHFYVDTQAGTGKTPAFTGVAKEVRSDVGGAYAFNVSIPDTFKDGKRHAYYAYALDINETSGKSNVKLIGSPRRIALVNGVIPIPSPTPAPVPTPTPTPPPAPVIACDGYGDSLSATKFDGWFTCSNETSAVITYENIADTSKTVTQTATRTIARTDAAAWLQQVYGASVSIAQPLGFSINPSAVVTAPGTYRVKQFKLSQSGTLIQLGAAAQGTFTIADPTPTPTPAPAPTPTPAPIPAPVAGDSKVYTIPTMAKPVVNVPFTDPVFGSKIVRVTDDVNYPVNLGAWTNSSGADRNINANSTRFIVSPQDTGPAILFDWDGANMKATKVGTLPSCSYDGSRWHPTDPNKVYCMAGKSIVEVTVPAMTTATVHNFASETTSSGYCSSRVMVSPDGDKFMATCSTFGGQDTWNRMVIWSRTQGLVKTLNFEARGLQPTGHNGQMDASWRYGIVSTQSAGADLVFWDTQTDTITKTITQVGPDYMGGHMTPGSGTWYYPDTGSDPGRWFVRNLSNPSQAGTALLSMTNATWLQDEHPCGIGPDGGFPVGYFISGGRPSQWGPYLDEIVKLYPTATGGWTWKRLAHHHSVYAGWGSQPAPSCSPDGKYIAFISNWGVAGGRMDMYMLQVP